MLKDNLDLVMFIADVCNMKCKYCYNKFPRTGKLADLDLFFNYASDLAKNSNHRIHDLVILGGEPTLHPNLVNFVNQLVKLDVQNVILWTNMQQSLEYYVKLMQSGMKIAMSWHGTEEDPKNIDFIKKALKLPDVFIHNGQVIELDLMAEQDNFRSFQFAYELLHKKYANTTCVWPVYTTDLVIGKYTDNQLQAYLQMTQFTKQNIFKVEKYEDDNNVQHLRMVTPEYNYQGWKCNAGLDYLYVHVNGDVYNCQSYYQYCQKPMYNIIETGGKADFSKHQPCICSAECCRFADYNVRREKI